MFVIGNNANVARYSGVNVARDKLLIMTTSGFVAGVAGVLFASRLGSVRGDLAHSASSSTSSRWSCSAG